ncbi:hypothetical protein Tsp_06328 [Trichinella spiralis]|uniref:hypothetical protein n=1 Tax=Trichinella spiralis TaxID=6334 RepID=UPI0001EFBECD|nr:hypothetical protein Tsp_06328 [Trichinella spiralis]
MLYNWPWTLSVTLMLPWTPYSSFECRKTGESTLNSISTVLFALKVYKGFVVECEKQKLYNTASNSIALLF